MKFWVSGQKTFKDLKSVEISLSQLFQNLFLMFNKNITFTDNFRCVVVENRFSTANYSYEIVHDLGIVPIGFINIKPEASGEIISDPNYDWNKRSIWLQSTSANYNGKILIIGA
jgi:hypothetical protein